MDKMMPYGEDVEALDENLLINLATYSDDQLKIYFNYNEAQIKRIRERYEDLRKELK